MRKLIIAALSSFLTLATPALPGTQDLDFVVNEMFYSVGFESEITHIGETWLERLGPALDQVGAEVRDEEAFKAAVVAPWIEDYRARIIKAHRAALEEFLSPEELSDIAEFLPTRDGQAFLALSPQNPPSTELLETLRASPLLPLFEHKRDIDKHTYTERVALKVDLSKSLRMGGVANLLADPDLVSFEDEENREQVVQSLRAMQ